MAAEGPGIVVHRFAGYAYDAARRELRDPGGRVVALRPQVETLLRCFLERPGHLLTRAELSARLWPQAVVTDDSLVQCVGELRAALHDADQGFVYTARGKGYRWDMPVERTVREAVPVAMLGSAVASSGMAPPAPSVAAADATPPRKRRLVTWIGAVAAAGALAIGLTGWSTSRRVNIDEAIAASSTLAVLPFSAAPDDPEARRLAEHAADAVTAQFPGRDGMRVIGRSVTAAHADETPQRIAKSLRARWILLGRVERVGTKATIDVQMQSTVDGSVGWSKQLDFAVDDKTALARLGRQVTNAIRTQSQSLKANGDGRFVGLPDAARDTLLASNDLDQRRSLDDVHRARGRLEAALQVDPGSLIARNLLAITYTIEIASPKHALTAADIAAADRMVEQTRAMAPNDPTALMLWGQMQTRRTRPDLAIPALEKAVAVAPSYANGYVLLAAAKLAAGQAREIRSLAAKAIELGEGDAFRVSQAHLLDAEAAFLLGDDRAALDAAARAVASRPGNVEARALLAAILSATGAGPRAADEMAAALRVSASLKLAHLARRRAYVDGVFVAERERLNRGFLAAGLPAGGDGSAAGPTVVSTVGRRP